MSYKAFPGLNGIKSGVPSPLVGFPDANYINDQLTRPTMLSTDSAPAISNIKTICTTIEQNISMLISYRSNNNTKTANLTSIEMFY
jgi:hypothetical protein